MHLARVALASILVSVAAALYMVGAYVPAFNTGDTPIAGVPRARSEVPPAPAIARRLVVIVTDGLSFERALALPELAGLRAEGALRGLTVEFPSYTSPSITTMVTGLGPRDSGIRLNGDELGVAGMDALPFVASDAGVPVHIRSRGWEVFERLVRALPAHDVLRGRVAFEAESAAQRAFGRDRPPERAVGPTRDLSFLYIEEVDSAAHRTGTTGAECVRAERFTGELASRYASRLDLREDVVVVLSDHGHVPKGGHGGVEPEVLRAYLVVAGRHVKRGVVLEDRPMRDVASTLAVLAGLAAPATNTGRPMLDLLDTSDADQARALAAPFDQASSFLCRLHRSARCAEASALLARLREGDGAARAPAESLLADVARERDAALDESARASGWTRLCTALLVLFGLGAALATRRRKDGEARPLGAVAPLFAVAYLLVYAGVMAGNGYGPSFSRMVPADVFFPDASAAGVAGGLLVTLLAGWVRPGRAASWWVLLGAAVPFALLAAWVGADPARLVPPHEGILLFFAAPAVLGAGLAAISLALVERSRGAARAAVAPATEAAPLVDRAPSLGP
jgi:hypothetical protein